MNKVKIVLIASTALACAGFASSSASARTVCDEYGRCWNEHVNALAIVAPLLGQGYGSRDEYIGRRDGWHHHYYGDRGYRRVQSQEERGYDRPGY